MSSVVTLITTMNLENADKLVKKMQVGSRFIIGNQPNEKRIDDYSIDEKEGLIVSTTLRGIGQNRNSIIERAQEDICVVAVDMCFCDNDVFFISEGYRKIKSFLFTIRVLFFSVLKMFMCEKKYSC